MSMSRVYRRGRTYSRNAFRFHRSLKRFATQNVVDFSARFAAFLDIGRVAQTGSSIKACLTADTKPSLEQPLHLSRDDTASLKFIRWLAGSRFNTPRLAHGKPHYIFMDALEQRMQTHTRARISRTSLKADSLILHILNSHSLIST